MVRLPRRLRTSRFPNLLNIVQSRTFSISVPRSMLNHIFPNETSMSNGKAGVWAQYKHLRVATP